MSQRTKDLLVIASLYGAALVVAALSGCVVSAFGAAPKPDVKAETITLDKDGNAVSVAREGRFVRLMMRESTPYHTDKTGVVKLFADSSVRLTRRQALRLTELLDDAMREIQRAGWKDDETALRSSVDESAYIDEYERYVRDHADECRQFD